MKKIINNWLELFRITSGIVFILLVSSCGGKEKEIEEETMIEPVKRQDIITEVSATATVLPRNRLEVKPSQSGRIEEIYVREGDRVKAGDVLCKMSSTDRAALIDAASAVSKEEVEYWNEVYKPIPVISPIDGEVIVRAVEPGQSINAGSVIVVLSDRLIVKARVDETDIGKIMVGQKTRIELDAYPEIKVDGSVEHISYESKVVNNVTMYEVDVMPDEIPPVFRSGMNAIVTIISSLRTNVLAVPVEVIKEENGVKWVIVSEQNKKQTRREIKTGFKGDMFVEVVDGLKEGEFLVVKKRKFSMPAGKTLNNPFFPQRRTGSGKSR